MAGGADQFNSFFKNKILTVRNNIDANINSVDAHKYDNAIGRDISLHEFVDVDNVSVRKLLLSCSSAFCSEIDVLPTTVIKENVEIFATFMECVINKSFRECVFPDAFKRGILLPKCKDPGKELENMSNYRPITNLRFLSKVVEKVVASQISDYVELNELLPSVQSAYRRGHSVETALCKLYNDLLMYVDSGKMAIMVQLDQSCAFDVLDFSILLQR